MNTWVKLHRKFIEWGWYSDSVVKCVFLHLLMTAAYKEGEYRGYKIYPGDVVIGRKKMASDLGFSEQQIRTALKKLESTGEITKKSTNKFTIVTVENWGEYQNYQPAEQPTDNQEITNKKPTNNQQVTTSKEIKKVRNKELVNVSNDTYGQISDSFNAICTSYPKVTRLTEKRKQKLKARLKSFSEEDIIKAFRLAEESDFLTGKVKDWKASFDWIIDSDNHIQRILEGVYANKGINKYDTARQKINDMFEGVSWTN